MANLWLIHDVWQKLMQYYKAIILQLNINRFKKVVKTTTTKENMYLGHVHDQVTHHCQQKEINFLKQMILKIVSHWGPVIQQTMEIINKDIRKIKLILYGLKRGTLQVDK